jgi:protein-S-isoprenylcysteine O-methyltransferase Ste14
MSHGLGFEHPLCDRIQLLMIILFFAIWIIDSLGCFLFGYSTVILEIITYPILLIGTIIFLFLSFYLIKKSHNAVLDQLQNPPKLVTSGVYGWVRHPMYLGVLLFCMAFLFLSFSITSIIIWVIFFILYDRMATFEEKSLIKILEEQYSNYQKQVPKWIPNIY